MHVVEASAAHERVYAHFYSAAYTPTFILLHPLSTKLPGCRLELLECTVRVCLSVVKL